MVSIIGCLPGTSIMNFVDFFETGSYVFEFDLFDVSIFTLTVCAKVELQKIVTDKKRKFFFMK